MFEQIFLTVVIVIVVIGIVERVSVQIELELLSVQLDTGNFKILHFSCLIIVPYIKVIECVGQSSPL